MNGGSEPIQGDAAPRAEIPPIPALPAGVSVIVPVYQSTSQLVPLVDRLEKVLRQTGQPFELLLVNDGSPDASWKAILEQSRRHAWVRGFCLMRNYGQHNALLCGVRAARYATTVTLDDDLQNPPEEIPKLLAKLAEGYDVVYGTPESRRHSVGHRVGARLLILGLSIALGARTARIVSPFRAFRTRLRRAFMLTRSPWVILDVFLTWATANFGEVRVRHDARPRGEIGYTVKKRVVMAFDMITGFSTLPLKLASWLGFFFTLFGIGVLLYQLGVYVVFRGETVPGFMFLASTIAIFSGAQLFALGILGEYLARMFDRVMERPAYTISATTDPADAASAGLEGPATG